MSLEKLAKEHELGLIKSAKEELISAPMQYLKDLNIADMPISNEDKGAIYEWIDSDIEETLFKLVGTVVLKRSVTAQQLIGMIFNRIRYNSTRQHIVDITLNAVQAAPFITCKRVGMYLMFSCTMSLSKEILDKQKRLSYILPSIELPLPVTDNNSIGYRTVKESLICGGKLKHHDKPLNYAHINKLNRNPYRVENRLQFLVKPKFNAEPKIKDNGEWETDLDISKRLEQWNRIITELPEKTKLLCEQGNRFFIHHRYDNGGRTYAKAYHLNYQGFAYCKAQVQAYNKELVEPEF